MPTIVYKGANRISDDGLIGKSIDDLKKDDIIVDALNLDGNESIRVNGSSVQSNYVIKSGDAVEFYKSQGTKGNDPGEPNEPDIEVEEEEGDDDEEDDEDDDEKEGD